MVEGNGSSRLTELGYVTSGWRWPLLWAAGVFIVNETDRVGLASRFQESASSYSEGALLDFGL